MKNAIILHGLPGKKEYYDPDRPSASNCHWIAWLQKQLMVKDIQAHTPEVYKSYATVWDDWVKEVERYDINQNTTLVGHSMGGGFWVRYLSEHPDIKVDKVILVAPWLNIDHELDITFFDFEISPKLADQANQFVVFSSDDDHFSVTDTVKLIASKLPSAQVKDFHKYGHFTYGSMKTDAFPELLKACLN